MQMRQSGFTLIELVIVMVILGLLAVTAIPTYVDLRTQAATAAVQGIGGSLSSAAAINFGIRTASSTNGVTINNCNTVSTAMIGGLPTNFVVNASAIGNGAAATCTVVNENGPSSVSTTFSAVGIT